MGKDYDDDGDDDDDRRCDCCCRSPPPPALPFPFPRRRSPKTCSGRSSIVIAAGVLVLSLLSGFYLYHR